MKLAILANCLHRQLSRVAKHASWRLSLISDSQSRLRCWWGRGCRCQCEGQSSVLCIVNGAADHVMHPLKNLWATFLPRGPLRCDLCALRPFLPSHDDDKYRAFKPELSQHGNHSRSRCPMGYVSSFPTPHFFLLCPADTGHWA